MRLLRATIVAASTCGMAAHAADTAPPSPKTAANREEWRAAMRRLPTPKTGCFTASYPHIEWRSTVCVTAPKRPFPPARGAGSELVGNGNDVSGYVKHLISSAAGSFPKVTDVTSEEGNVNGSPPKIANTYSLQLNTDFFTSSACNGGSNCQGWQQFVYSSSEGIAFMQYWLLDYVGAANTDCPDGWTPYDKDCYNNSQATTVNGGAPIPISQLIDLGVSGAAVTDGTDTMTFNDGNVAYSVTGPDSVLNLGKAWHAAEFNVVGDCCSSRAVFNQGATIKVEIVVNHGNANAPTCLGEGFTGETNNMYFIKNITHKLPGSPPAIHFVESVAATTTSACGSATSVGD